jgi:SAM-dependent methyltransferase
MVEEARRRACRAGVADRVDVQHVGIHEIDRLAGTATRFDAAYSNFGPLNCVADLRTAVAPIVDRLKPGGVLVASVIGRVCPWEIAIYAGRGEVSRAAIRFRRGLVPVPLDGNTVWTRYFSPREFERILTGAGLRRVSLRTLGLFVPPPYLQGFADRHPALVAYLQRVEDRCGHWPVLRACGDHFLIVCRKG